MTEQELDLELKELNDFRKRFDNKLLMYYPYPRVKQAIAQKEIKIWRNDNGEIEGYIWLKNLKRKRISRVEEIYSKKKGLGTIMMNYAKDNSWFDVIELKVLDFNDYAINFYIKHGFKEVSREQGGKVNNITMLFEKPKTNLYETT